VFRVGRADETLTTSGVTHLVEHLALHPLRGGESRSNGATGLLHTHFHVEGTEAEVVGFLNGVCAALRALPLERLPAEKEILRTEARGNLSGPGRELPLWRYGAQGHGLVSYPEWGLHRLTAEQVAAWAATRFTRRAAALWIASDRVPDGLVLDLPDGPAPPPPPDPEADGPELLPRTPAWFASGGGAVVMDTVVPRGPEAVLLARLLGRVLQRELRHERGLSYTAAAGYEQRDAHRAHLTALADGLPHREQQLTDGFLDVLEGLRAGRTDPADLAAARAGVLEVHEHPDAEARALPGAAAGLLLGRPVRSPAELREQALAVGPDQVAALAREAVDAALLKIPSGCRVTRAGWSIAPTGSTHGVTAGRRHPSLDGSGETLLVGPDAVGTVDRAGRPLATVRYDDCALMVTRPDGARYLIGRDGMPLDVEPTLLERGSAAVAALDRHIPTDLVVALPARPRAEIPVPPPPAPPARRRRRLRLRLPALAVHRRPPTTAEAR